MPTKTMNHSEYQKKVKKMSREALLYVIQDAQKAARCARTLPDGGNEGYYLDEIHYCSMELKRRGM